MKKLSQQLKRAANALAFANAGNLHALNTMLNMPECGANQAERRDTARQRKSNIIVAQHSPSL